MRFEHTETEVELDLQVAKTQYESQMIERAANTSGMRIPVASAEDLLVLKLIQQVDLARRADIDWAYVGHWAHVWHVSEQLARLREANELYRQQLAALFDDPAEVPTNCAIPPRVKTSDPSGVTCYTGSVG